MPHRSPVGPDPAAAPLDRVNTEPAEPGLRRTVGILAALLRRITRRDWRAQDKIPRSGPAIFVVNHISNFDPLAYGHYLAWSGRWPRFLAKDAIFRTPVLGAIARACGQIRVQRGAADGGTALAEAAAALGEGKSVTIYPEGTITADPEGWPMTGRTGAARLALETGAPVIPVGQWGAQEVLPGKRLTWPRLWPRRTMRLIAGDPVPLDDLRERPLDAGTLITATERITDAITGLVAQLRETEPPAGRWDLRLGRRVGPRAAGR
ncbi:lysophospholipid acyltransferase family protein [Naumannella cuiyingiana]|uniref:1-acyl-sn-glycerol-3-phosphate acyltransferase n=1 Tax=Naumannella cuiyingiana TaxID=1347891 RepID=A0A7Z0IM87_9ACTN|nr:lysophospholipid acyltransferase family protein [Naumannella cuiyingiana]NYI72484.1 1-acyl-sn-glycerol-3-phosphate acyltransferase [Naumannella cuiyingiana]